MKNIFRLGVLFFLFLLSCHRSPDFLLVDSASRRSPHPQEGWGKEYIVASEGKAASEAAKWAFDNGGNIVDAFTAASFAISVERPFNSGLGGGGFALVHLKNKRETFALDFREVAPEKAWSHMFVNRQNSVIYDRSQTGPYASGVPGLVRGVLELHGKYGQLPLAKVMAPSIKAAEEGIVVYPFMAKAMKYARRKLLRFPSSGKIFLKAKGRPYEEGERLFQKDLAKTLRTISKKGTDGFYKGWVGRAIADSQKEMGGLISEKDLNNYQAKYRRPLKGDYKGFQILSMPPPSSGGVLVIQILQFLENDPLKEWGPYSPKAIHLVTAAMKRAFADRAKYLGDSDFVKVPILGLISKEYAQSLRSQVRMRKVVPSENIRAGAPAPIESDDTIHFTIMDSKGNVISSTQSINGIFGSGVVVEGTGILLNNHMDDFSIKPGQPNLYGMIGGSANAIKAGKRPLSSMSPTIIFKEGEPILALGSPGGPRIITCVLQTILNYLEFKMPLYESVSTLRYHHQWLPDEILLEEPGFPNWSKRKLKQMGYKFKDWPSSQACRVQAVAREEGRLHGVSDPRRDGSVRSDLKKVSGTLFKGS